jgi:hypothetical protein
MTTKTAPSLKTIPNGTAVTWHLYDHHLGEPDVLFHLSKALTRAAKNWLSRMNWLRAVVLGANGGIISTVGKGVGVAAIGADRGPTVAAGVAGLVASAVSMALGEYVSVTSRRDTERSLRSDQREDLLSSPQLKCAHLAGLYEAKGMSPKTAWTVAKELTKNDAFAAHVDAQLGSRPRCPGQSLARCCRVSDSVHHRGAVSLDLDPPRTRWSARAGHCGRRAGTCHHRRDQRFLGARQAAGCRTAPGHRRGAGDGGDLWCRPALQARDRLRSTPLSAAVFQARPRHRIGVCAQANSRRPRAGLP